VKLRERKLESENGDEIRAHAVPELEVALEISGVDELDLEAVLERRRDSQCERWRVLKRYGTIEGNVVSRWIALIWPLYLQMGLLDEIGEVNE
jgi:hypothetical protein